MLAVSQLGAGLPQPTFVDQIAFQMPSPMELTCYLDNVDVLCWRVESTLIFFIPFTFPFMHFKHLCMPNLSQPHFLHMRETKTESDFCHVIIVVVTK